MERYPRDYRDWDNEKGRIVLRMGTRVVARTPDDCRKLRHAAEQIGAENGIVQLDDQAAKLALDLTSNGLKKLNKAFRKPEPTLRELRDRRVFDKFLSLMS